MLQIVLLAGKFAFLVILYLFIFWVVRSTTRELRASSSSIPRRSWAPTAGGVPTAGSIPTVGAAGAGSAVALVDGGGSAEGVGRDGRGEWLLVVERSPVLPKGAVFAFPLGCRVLVGRSHEADIQLSDTFVSSRHALFEVTAEGLVIEDLGSTNGTQVNREDVDGPYPLQSGDEVQIGDTIFKVGQR